MTDFLKKFRNKYFKFLEVTLVLKTTIREEERICVFEENHSFRQIFLDTIVLDTNSWLPWVLGVSFFLFIQTHMKL